MCEEQSIFNVPYYHLPIEQQIAHIIDKEELSQDNAQLLTDAIQMFDDVTIVTLNDTTLVVTYANGLLCKAVRLPMVFLPNQEPFIDEVTGEVIPNEHISDWIHGIPF
jgi:hypothetical protein